MAQKRSERKIIRKRNLWPGVSLFILTVRFLEVKKDNLRFSDFFFAQLLTTLGRLHV